MATGEMPPHVKVQGTGTMADVTLKDVLWVPGRPYRLLSTEDIRRDGGELVDSGRKDGYPRYRKDGPKIL